MRKLFHFLFHVAAAVLIVGCTHRAPRAVVVPTTAPVRVAVAAVEHAHVRVAAIAARAAKSGIKPGSEEARELSLATFAEGSEEKRLHAEVDQLTQKLLEVQKQADKQTTQLAWYVGKYNEAVKTIWWYREHFLFPLIAAGLLLVATVGIWIATKFTDWGAHTFGPYVLGAEHLAAKAAVVAAA